MNSRIKELAKQARKYADHNEEHWKSGPSWDSLFEQKFAELIVSQCADVMINDPRLRDVRSASRGCARSIKEHFGVEE